MASGIRRVCIDVRGLPPGSVNGTGVYALELLRRLPADTSVFVSGEEQRATFQALGIRTLETVAELGECRIFHRPSQIYEAAHLDIFLGSSALPVITCLDLISYRAPALFGSFEAYRRFRGFLFASLSTAQAVLAISEHGRREILEEFHLSPERVHCTPLGVDASMFSARDAGKSRDLLRRHGIGGRYFLCAGSDLPHKNLGPLLRGYALLRLRWTGPDPLPELVLIGHRSGAPGGIFDLGASPAQGVRYLGAVDRDHVPPLYQEALALVYPSSYEGFGLPVLEAMAAGIPVLCSRLTSIPEVAGDAALYLEDFSMDELAERMSALARDGELRARLIEAGQQRAQSFRWDETARKTMEVYAAVAGQPSGAVDLHRRMLVELSTIDEMPAGE
jgi:glycosyltransferase involved in cell wall biosynthesis